MAFNRIRVILQKKSWHAFKQTHCLTSQKKPISKFAGYFGADEKRTRKMLSQVSKEGLQFYDRHPDRQILSKIIISLS